MSGSKEENIDKHIMNSDCTLLNHSELLYLFGVALFTCKLLLIYLVKAVTQCTVFVCDNLSIEYIIDNHCFFCVKLVLL